MVCFFGLARVIVTDVVVRMAAEEIKASLTNPFVFLDCFPDWELR
jgi:hypothetical protein